MHQASDLRRRAAALFGGLQDTICEALAGLEATARFREDAWARPGGGGGRTRVLEGGEVVEKGGVNFSEVHGALAPPLAATLPGTGDRFWAAGLSLVLHPRNPYAPTTHTNLRMLVRGDTAWFGGGADLTPFYLFEEDAAHFHRTLARACEIHPPSPYPALKAACDRYFYLPHRGEHRGIGGVFFDRLTPESTGRSAEENFGLVRAIGEAFLPAYLPLLRARAGTPHGPPEREWQLIRRGRYVEFNLLHDRGTLFGLQTGGRLESILMSLPPQVSWRYDHSPAVGSPEARLLAALRAPRDWI